MSPNSGSATGIPVSIIAPSLHTTLSSTFPNDSRSTCHSVPVSFDTVRLGLELWRSPTIWLIQTAPGSTDTEIQRHASLQLDHRPRSLKLMKQLTGSHCCLSECNFFWPVVTAVWDAHYSTPEGMVNSKRKKVELVKLVKTTTHQTSSLQSYANRKKKLVS